jgi:hypothetical protein
MSTSSKIPAPSYTNTEITHGLARAGNRCELHATDGSRCVEAATSHAPFLVWVNGGEPPMDNFVAACPIHAARYSNGITFLRSIRIVRNRKGYFPRGENVAPAVIAAAITTTLP